MPSTSPAAGSRRTPARRSGSDQAIGGPRSAARLRDREGGGDPQALGVELIALAEPDHQQARPASGRSSVCFLKPPLRRPRPAASR